jgi:hypothetical protein
MLAVALNASARAGPSSPPASGEPSLPPSILDNQRSNVLVRLAMPVRWWAHVPFLSSSFHAGPTLFVEAPCGAARCPLGAIGIGISLLYSVWTRMQSGLGIDVLRVRGHERGHRIAVRLVVSTVPSRALRVLDGDAVAAVRAGGRRARVGPCAMQQERVRNAGSDLRSVRTQRTRGTRRECACQSCPERRVPGPWRHDPGRVGFVRGEPVRPCVVGWNDGDVRHWRGPRHQVLVPLAPAVGGRWNAARPIAIAGEGGPARSSEATHGCHS